MLKQGRSPLRNRQAFLLLLQALPRWSDSLFAAEPPKSNYDVHFNVAGVPVRVHPWFLLMSLLLGVGSFNKPNPPQEIILWMGVVFISILIHELGHVAAFRYFGQRAKVVLYSFGG